MLCPSLLTLPPTAFPALRLSDSSLIAVKLMDDMDVRTPGVIDPQWAPKGVGAAAPGKGKPKARK